METKIFFISVCILVSFSSTNCYPSEDIVAKLLIESSNSFRVRRGVESKATEKCSESEVDVMNAEIDSCFIKVNEDLQKAIDSSTNILPTLCDNLGGKLNCYETSGPKCYTAEEMHNLRFNFLTDQTEIARNQTRSLGETFVDSCPLLKQHKADYIDELLGPTNCSYINAFRVLEAKKVCIEKAQEARSTRETVALDFLTFRDLKISALKKSHCTYKADVFGCYEETIYICLSDEKIVETIEKTKNNFKKSEEEFFAETGIELGNCPNSVA